MKCECLGAPEMVLKTTSFMARRSKQVLLQKNVFQHTFTEFEASNPGYDHRKVFPFTMPHFPHI